MREFNLPKHYKIRDKKDFIHLKQSGKKIQNSDFIIIFSMNSQLNSRLGITVSKRVGCAVTRNRIKRIIREYFRKNRYLLTHHLDYNYIAKPFAAKRTNEELYKSLQDITKKIGNKICG